MGVVGMFENPFVFLFFAILWVGLILLIFVFILRWVFKEKEEVRTTTIRRSLR